jgi:hypothetical protein
VRVWLCVCCAFRVDERWILRAGRVVFASWVVSLSIFRTFIPTLLECEKLAQEIIVNILNS